jgi:hypothetical protein
METVKQPQRAILVAAISGELQRQAESGNQRIDIEALADAVLNAHMPSPLPGEGRRPQDLNASNDG